MMVLAYTLTAVNLFIAFLLFLRARRLRDEAEALRDYKLQVARKVNEAYKSFTATQELHKRQIEILETRNAAITEEFNKLLNKESEPLSYFLTFSYRAERPRGYRLN